MRPSGRWRAAALADDVRRSSVLVGEHRRRELDRLRGELSARDRTLPVLRIDQGRSWPEIAPPRAIR